MLLRPPSPAAAVLFKMCFCCCRILGHDHAGHDHSHGHSHGGDDVGHEAKTKKLRLDEEGGSGSTWILPAIPIEMRYR